MIKSKKQIKVISDGVYKANWCGFVVTLLRPNIIDNDYKASMLNDYYAIKNDGLSLDVEVDKGIKGVTRKNIEIIDGWLYIDLSKEESTQLKRELKLNTLLDE